MERQLGGFLSRTISHGHKFRKDGDAYKVSGSWTKKYLINKKLFYKLWTDAEFGKRYFSLDGLSPRVQKLVRKYYSKDTEETTPRTIPPEEDVAELFGEKETRKDPPRKESPRNESPSVPMPDYLALEMSVKAAFKAMQKAIASKDESAFNAAKEELKSYLRSVENIPEYRQFIASNIATCKYYKAEWAR